MNWICLMVDSTTVAKGHDHLESELYGIFHEDMGGMEIILPLEQDIESYYVMVKCRNYANYKKELRDSRIILSVVSSYENPVYLSEDEVDCYRQSMEEKERRERKGPSGYVVGDIVSPKDGYLCGLIGLIVDIIDDMYDVRFRFHTRSFTSRFEYKCLEFISSMLDIDSSS